MLEAQFAPLCIAVIKHTTERDNIPPLCCLTLRIRICRRQERAKLELEGCTFQPRLDRGVHGPTRTHAGENDCFRASLGRFYHTGRFFVCSDDIPYHQNGSRRKSTKRAHHRLAVSRSNHETRAALRIPPLLFKCIKRPGNASSLAPKSIRIHSITPKTCQCVH